MAESDVKQALAFIISRAHVVNLTSVEADAQFSTVKERFNIRLARSIELFIDEAHKTLISRINPENRAWVITTIENERRRKDDGAWRLNEDCTQIGKRAIKWGSYLGFFANAISHSQQPSNFTFMRGMFYGLVGGAIKELLECENKHHTESIAITPRFFGCTFLLAELSPKENTNTENDGNDERIGVPVMR